jgi:hypothetical protein
MLVCSHARFSFKIETYLTFFNVHLERQGADIQSKVQELERLNQSMRIRDKMKDDVIAHLPGQLIALTARLDQSKDDGNRSLRVLNRRY